MNRSKPRILLYSHDTYGLGHLRRTLAIAGQLARDLPKAHQLLLTGSMVAGAFGLPPRLDMVKLPALSKRSSGKYTARALPLSLSDTIAWRKQMILQAVTAFKPDLVLVDKSPAGVQGELLPTLRYLKTWSPETRLILGMRDIEDEPEATRAEWAASDVPHLHDEVYDHILYYGQRSIFDPGPMYEMSPRATAKLVECGYLGRDEIEAARPESIVRRELGIDDQPLVVVTVGGGGDGHDVIKTYLDMLAGWPGGAPFYSLIVTGPLMAQGKRRLLRQAVQTNHLTLLDFTPDLFSYAAAADLVVGMAGYNTVCETLSLGKRAVFVPRVRPRGEQRLRAERLAARGLARMILPDDLSPDRLMAEVQAALDSPAPTVTLDMNGLSRVSRAVASLLAPPSASNGNGHEPQEALALERMLA
ncbi:MAG: glycosyltransferase [Chloroflexota bacterium]